MAWMVPGASSEFGNGNGCVGLFCAHEGGDAEKKLLLRHSRFVPVRNTSSSAGHLRTGATNAAPDLSMPTSAWIPVMPPSVVREIAPKIHASIQ